MTTHTKLRVTTLFAAMALAAGGAYAQSASRASSTTPSASHETESGPGAKRRTNEAAEAQEQVDSATQVVSEMKRDPEIAKLLDQARGVLIVPRYSKGAFIVGGEGGGAVALLRNKSASKEWSAPAFYHIGGISIGAEAGGKSGAIAMLLMSDKATESLMSQKNKFSFGANAGLTVVNWGANAQGSTGNSDVIVWSDTKGAFGGVGVGVKDMKRDANANEAYYGRAVEPHDILTGQVTTARADTLRNALGRTTG